MNVTPLSLPVNTAVLCLAVTFCQVEMHRSADAAIYRWDNGELITDKNAEPSVWLPWQQSAALS